MFGIRYSFKDGNKTDKDKDIFIMFRKPESPVILIYENDLYSYNNLKELLANLAYIKPTKEDDLILIDSTGAEFQYNFSQRALSPSFLMKRWTKKQIVDLYNKSCKNPEDIYSKKSFSNVKFEKLFNEICTSISINNLDC